MFTARTVPEEAQQLTGAALAALLDCSPAFIIATDVSGNIRFINQVLPQYTREEVIGTHWLRYVAPHERADHEARFARVLRTGTTEHYETTIAGPNGESLCFSAHMGALRLDDQVVGTILVSQDVTELKRTQADYAAAQRLAALGTLAAGIAHEINTPVQFVSDSVQFLREGTADVLKLLEPLTALRRRMAAGALDAELGQALERLATTAEEIDLEYLAERIAPAFDRCAEGLERVAKIVRAMKELAHPAETEMAFADLNAMVESTLTLARSRYEGVATLETDFGVLPPVRCFAGELNQVVLNLVVNAAHAVADVVQRSGKLGSIQIATRVEGDDAVISVTDTGTGMPESVAQRVFEPFFTTKGVGQGTGHGLALAWAVVKDKHGGELRFTTEVGKGTTFFVRIPVAGL
ncbi:MAG TPA: ATP-binding protein [Polyangiaceae bacterium]|jgi:PAS domain S-box-containing protein|nr:ATP-binding protein [Polyangiaceae bacterium]